MPAFAHHDDWAACHVEGGPTDQGFCWLNGFSIAKEKLACKVVETHQLSICENHYVYLVGDLKVEDLVPRFV